MLNAGYYKGKILAYGIKRTAKGDAAPTIKFAVVDSQAVTHHVYWQGSWNGGGMEHCMKALLVCGFSNPTKLQNLAEGVASGLLDMEKAYDLDIEVQIDQNDPSKKYNRVKWINDAGGVIKDAMTVQEFAADAASRDLAAHLIRIAQEHGFKLNSSPVTTHKVNEADIPF